MTPATFRAVLALSCLSFPAAAQAKTKVVVTYPYIESLVREIARDRVDLTVLAKGDEDPHFVVPRPSFIGKLRQADLFIMNGGSLEVGFAPPLLRKASNPKVVPGAEGFVDLSQSVELIDRPASVSRAEGDVHPEGNPHFILDWHNVPAVARAIAGALGRADPPGAAAYQENLEDFLTRFEARSQAWDRKAQALKGKRVLQYHRLFNYFARRAGLTLAGELEPKPGIPPSASHVLEIIRLMRARRVPLLLQEDYYPDRTAQLVAQKTTAQLVVLPGGTDFQRGQRFEARLEQMVRQVVQALQRARR